MTTPSSKLYQDLHYPTAIVDAVASLQSDQLKSSTALQTGSPQTRYWLSQARRMGDATNEIIVVTFKQPSSVSMIAFDLLEISQSWQVFYYNRAGQRIPVRDQSYGELKGQISSGNTASWYTISKSIYPIVATKIEIVLSRIPDFTLPATQVVPLGMRGLLLKREIYTRQDATLPLEPSTDLMGNLVVKTVKDWDPGKAIDNSSTTFWRSSPQPSHDAVVSFYMDVRDASHLAQRVDRIYIDPVHAGQFLNVYYSTDDTVRTRRLGTTLMAPTTQVNASADTTGLRLDQSDSNYVLNGSQIGLKSSMSYWVGVGWAPNFPSNQPPPSNLTLFTTGAGATLFSITYNVMTKTFTLVVGAKTITTTAVQFGVGAGIELVVGVTRSTDNPHSLPVGITFYVCNSSGHVITSAILQCDPPQADFLPSIAIKNVQGHITSLLVKQETLQVSTLNTYLANKSLYLSPDPVQPDSQGLLPSTSLDNAIMCADFTVQQVPYGGVDQTYFEEKKWTPIFRDFVATRGFLYFPTPVMTSYLKLEFTNLTEEQYPIWEDGIEVKYQTYPINVTLTSKATTTTTTTKVVTSSTNSKPTIDRSVSSSTTLAQDVQVKVGDSSLNDVPHLYDKPPATTVASETSSSVVHKRTATNKQTIAQNQTYTVTSGDYLIKIAAKYHLDWQVVYKANKKLIDSDSRVGLLPSRSSGWWIFPGQKLKIPSSVMAQITKTTTTTERKQTTKTTRTRFSVTQVHRYEIQTATRDSSMAYFAGLRSVQAYRAAYAPPEDTDAYTVLKYDAADFTLTNTSLQPNGTVKNSFPTSGTGRTNLVLNPGFESDLYGWYPSKLPLSATPDSVSPILTRTAPGYLSGWSLSVDFVDGSGVRTVCTDVATSPGSQYIFSAYVNPADPAQKVQAKAVLTGGTVVSGTTTTAGVLGYQRVSVAFTANDTTTSLVLQGVVAGAGTVVQVDGALCEAGNTLQPYFDGNTPFCSWTDPTHPNRSTSVEYQDVLRNLVKNPSFEYGLDGWTPWRGQPGVTQATLSAFTGSHSLGVRWSGTPAGQEAVGCVAEGLRVGLPYTLSGYVYVPTGSGEVTLQLDGGATVTTPAGVRDQFRRIQITFTATTPTQAFYFTNATASAVGTSAYIDSVQLVQGSSPLTYFDGDTAGYTWAGDPGMSPSVALLSATTRGTVLSNVWASTSVYKRIQLSVFDSGFNSPATGIIGVGPVGLTPGAPVATWADATVKWADKASPWGAPLPLVTATFDSSRQFQGKTAALFYRASGQGAAVGGVTSRLFSAFAGTRVRYSTTLFLTAQTSNQYQIQLYDQDTNSVLFSENITPKPGNWFTFTSHFQNLTATHNNLAVRVLVSGNSTEYMYVGELRADLSTVLYEVSNDGGTNFYDATEAVYTQNANFVFPVAGNQFRTRITLNAPDDYVMGFEMVPLYLN